MEIAHEKSEAGLRKWLLKKNRHELISDGADLWSDLMERKGKWLSF